MKKLLLLIFVLLCFTACGGASETVETTTQDPPTTTSANVIPLLVNQKPEEIAKQIPAGGNISVVSDGHKIDMYVPSLSKAIVTLCDGKKDLNTIHKVIREKRKLI